MIIKYTGHYDDRLGSQDAIRIEGINVKNGEEWSKKIFANNRKLVEVLEDTGVGEHLNVTMTQKNQYWNVTDIGTASAELVEAAKANSGGSNISTNTGRGGGGTVSKWNGRTGEAYDRSAAVYLAFDMLKTTMTEAALKKLGIEGVLEQTIGYADVLDDYIHSGTNSFDDPLEPPVD